MMTFIALGCTHAAHAQRSMRASTPEDIALAFYKTGGIIPNFENWVKKQAPYINTPWAMREDIYNEELYRLQLAYQNFDPEKNFLVVKTFSNINPIKNTDDEGVETYNIEINFSKAPEALYFPYALLEERIILMPYHLESIMSGEISDLQYAHIDKITNPRDDVHTIIHMRPHEADFSKPYKIDGLEQWVFKTKIISIEMWSNKDELIWEYTAPKYKSKNTIDLQNLYKDRPQDSKFKKGRVKPTTHIK